MDNIKNAIFEKLNKPSRCPVCRGTLKFNGVGEYECEKCGAKTYDDYGKVRNYIESHKGATTAEISFATGVSQRAINEMLRDERFEITADSKSFLKCRGCGIELRSGVFCLACAKIAEAAEARKARAMEKKAKNLSGVGVEVPKETSDGAMRFKRD